MKYMNATELLAFLEEVGLPCSKTSLQRMVRERRIPHYRIPNPTSPPKFLEEDISSWLQDRRVPMAASMPNRSRG